MQRRLAYRSARDDRCPGRPKVAETFRDGMCYRVAQFVKDVVETAPERDRNLVNPLGAKQVRASLRRIVHIAERQGDEDLKSRRRIENLGRACDAAIRDCDAEDQRPERATPGP